MVSVCLCFLVREYCVINAVVVIIIVFSCQIMRGVSL